MKTISPSAAHRLSQRFIIDPAYSATTPRPPISSYALAHESAAAVNWLYAPGDMEAFLLARMKMEGFRDSREVAHPGLFRTAACTVYFSRNFSVTAKQVGKIAPLRFRHSGLIRISLNGVALAWHTAEAGKMGDVRLDLRGKLKPGENSITVIMCSLGEPCTFSLAEAGWESDANWRTSHDGQRWGRPTCVPVAVSSLAPHWEPLPTVPIKPVRLADDLYEVRPEVVGSLEIHTRKPARLVIIQGESPEEVRAGAQAEQHVFRLNAKAGQIIHAPRAALSHFTLNAPPSAVGRIVCHADSYPLAYRGAFACDDPVLTRIWMHSAYTLRLCLRELLVDGVKRDRMPWVGDLFVAILSNAAAFGVPGPIRRTLIALAGLNARENHSNGIIDYTLYWLMSIERHDWYFHDPEFIRDSRSLVVEMLAGLSASEDAHGWLMPRAHDWLFLDWAEMEKTGVVSALQFLYVWALRSVEKLAARVGWTDLHAQVQRKRTRLESQCRRTFWDAPRGGFVETWHNGKRSNSIGRHANFLAILSGTTSATESKSILRRVLNNPEVRQVGTPYMRFFENFARAQAGDAATMMSDVKRYWGGMLEVGATTFWEAYDPAESRKQHLAFYGRPFGRSLCHVWASGPAYLLSQEASGLEMLQPRWAAFTLRRQQTPFKPLHVCMPTPCGEIVLDRTEKSSMLKIPQGCTYVEQGNGKVRRHIGPRTISLHDGKK